jgi:cyanophycinase
MVRTLQFGSRAAGCETIGVERSIAAVGSVAAFATYLSDQSLSARTPGADLVVLPTAAAFTGIAQAAVGVARVCDEFNVTVEALMVGDRASTSEIYFASRILEATMVVLCDGSSLHALSVWRDSPVGEALARTRRIIAIGASASVLGEIMIDPRGGAPTVGLGLFSGVAFCAPAVEDQLQRTRSLLDEQTALVVLGARGVLTYDSGEWRVAVDDDVVVSRGLDVTEL